MIPTPYQFEPDFSMEEFAKVGQFALRWSHMEHTIGNCLRRLLELTPENANVLIFPLSLDARMKHITNFAKLKPLEPKSAALFSELKPLIRAMQYIRNSAIHGIVVDLGNGEEPVFELRSKSRKIRKADLFCCEDLINYTAFVVQAFRMSLGEKASTWSSGWGSHDYAVPHRPLIPDWLPNDCRSFPKADTLLRQ